MQLRNEEARELDPWPNERNEFVALGLLRKQNGSFVLTPRGQLLADSVAAGFLQPLRCAKR